MLISFRSQLWDYVNVILGQYWKLALLSRFRARSFVRIRMEISNCPGKTAFGPHFQPFAVTPKTANQLAIHFMTVCHPHVTASPVLSGSRSLILCLVRAHLLRRS